MGDSKVCGDIKTWETNRMYDVTSTRGCSTLGVAVRDSDYVLIKVEKHHSQSAVMLISEMKSNQSDFYTQVTHFSPKLKRCSVELISNSPILYDITSSRGYSLSMSLNLTLLLVLAVIYNHSSTTSG